MIAPIHQPEPRKLNIESEMLAIIFLLAMDGIEKGDGEGRDTCLQYMREMGATGTDDEVTLHFYKSVLHVASHLEGWDADLLTITEKL